VGKPFNEFHRDLPLANPADVKSNYYFALDTPDEKGKILHLSEIFNSEDISFEQVLQQKANGTTARIVVITHAMSKTQLKAVTEKLEAAEDFTVVNTLKVLSN
jgi:homoserine dehydrogenase